MADLKVLVAMINSEQRLANPVWKHASEVAFLASLLKDVLKDVTPAKKGGYLEEQRRLQEEAITRWVSVHQPTVVGQVEVKDTSITGGEFLLQVVEDAVTDEFTGYGYPPSFDEAWQALRQVWNLAEASKAQKALRQALKARFEGKSIPEAEKKWARETRKKVAQALRGRKEGEEPSMAYAVRIRHTKQGWASIDQSTRVPGMTINCLGTTRQPSRGGAVSTNTSNPKYRREVLYTLSNSVKQKQNGTDKQNPLCRGVYKYCWPDNGA